MFDVMVFAGLSSPKLTLHFGVHLGQVVSLALNHCQSFSGALTRCTEKFSLGRHALCCAVLWGYQLTFSLLFGFSPCAGAAGGADAAAHKAETAAGGAE